MGVKGLVSGGCLCKKQPGSIFAHNFPCPAFSRLACSRGKPWLPLASAAGCALQEVRQRHHSGQREGAQEASCWRWTCKDWCHLVSAVASHDPRELLHSQLVSQLFGAPLSKHKVLNSCFSYSFKVCFD